MLRRNMEDKVGMKHSAKGYEGRADGKYTPVPKHFRQSTKLQICAAAKRFAKEGDIRNAVEILLIAYPDANLTVRKATGANVV